MHTAEVIKSPAGEKGLFSPTYMINLDVDKEEGTVLLQRVRSAMS
jgi:hypothetical protein